MKKSAIINLLNQDLTGEIEAILIYMRDSFVTPQCRPSREMEEIARDEMRHAEKLSELIVDLGGVPSMEHRELNFGKGGPKGYLRRLIELEKGAIAMYKEHIAIIPDEKIKKLLTHILHEEEGHLQEFIEQLREFGRYAFESFRKTKLRTTLSSSRGLDALCSDNPKNRSYPPL